MNSKPTILVLGATGKVGGETVRRLVAAGDSRVLAAVRSPEKAQLFESQGIETVSLDLDRPETLASALHDVDRALLLTGYTVDMLRQSKRFIDEAKKLVYSTLSTLVHPAHQQMKLPTGAGISSLRLISNAQALALLTCALKPLCKVSQRLVG